MSEIRDKNSFSSRMTRYGKVASRMGGFAANYAVSRFQGKDDDAIAAALVEVLGQLKGPLVKIAQLLAMIPDLLPSTYAEELMQLQSQVPPMGKLFVKRRMRGELGENWERHFQAFDLNACAAASLGQVHQATSLDATRLACKLQYPDMAGTVEADLQQLKLFFSFYEKSGGGIKHDNIYTEIVARLREELDYKHEMQNILDFARIMQDRPGIHIPVPKPELSTTRLLTMQWLSGDPIQDYFEAPEAMRQKIARHLFYAWYYPLYGHGILHGDPHMGNYQVKENGNIVLYDFGCVRRFEQHFVRGIIELYRAMQTQNKERMVEAYKLWGFQNLSNELIDVLTLWATYLYAPLLDDRVRPIDPEYSSKKGQEVAKQVFQSLRRLQGVAPPQEFVFVDRAAVGLGSVFMRLRAHLNWHQLFEEIIQATGH